MASDLRQCINDALRNLGVNQAEGVRVEFTDGRVVEIHSDGHPALRQPTEASDIRNITRTSSAKAGAEPQEEESNNEGVEPEGSKAEGESEPEATAAV
jgi:hypothetical protein